MLEGLTQHTKQIQLRTMLIILDTRYMWIKKKSCMYRVTHVAAVDGFSGMIVGFITMPVKNNVEIYSNLYRWVKDLFNG